MESEYNALSLCMKTVLPFQCTLNKVIASLKQNENETPITFKISVWEDNVGALTLANLERGRLTPQSKHYTVKTHWWFRSHLKPNSILVKKIESTSQKADIFTKGLTKASYESIRKQLCGWQPFFLRSRGSVSIFKLRRANLYELIYLVYMICIYSEEELRRPETDFASFFN